MENNLLSNHPLYEGDDVDDARQVLSSLYAEVKVEPLSTAAPFSALVNGLVLPRSAISYTKYEYGMAGELPEPLDFHTIQLGCSTDTVFYADDVPVHCESQRGVVLSAGQRIKLHHSPGNILLSYIVKDEVIRDVVSAWTGHSKIPPIRFLPQIDLGDPRSASLVSLFQNFVKEIDRPGSVLDFPAAVASFENTLITYMLFGLEHNLSENLRAPAAGAGSEQVRQVEEYIEANATRPIDITTLSRLTGHSTDSIFRAFRKYREYTPMEFLKEVRMRRVRERLASPLSAGSVTQIAMDCGFTHLGRFAAEYRRRFGENPSETLNRSSCFGDRNKH